MAELGKISKSKSGKFGLFQNPPPLGNVLQILHLLVNETLVEQISFTLGNSQDTKKPRIISRSELRLIAPSPFSTKFGLKCSNSLAVWRTPGFLDYKFSFMPRWFCHRGQRY